MITAIFMLAVGLLLIFLEFFLPGAVMGTAGGILFVLSIIFYAMESDNVAYVALFTIGSVVLLGVVIKAALWRVRAGAKDSTFYLAADQEGFHAEVFNQAVVGMGAVAATDLKPSGFILVNGERLQAVSKAGYIPKGNEVEVIGGKGAYLIVKLSKKDAK